MRVHVKYMVNFQGTLYGPGTHVVDPNTGNHLIRKGAAVWVAWE